MSYKVRIWKRNGIKVFVALSDELKFRYKDINNEIQERTLAKNESVYYDSTQYGVIYPKEKDLKYAMAILGGNYSNIIETDVFNTTDGVIITGLDSKYNNEYSMEIELTDEVPTTDSCRLTSNRLSPPKFKLRKLFSRVKNRISNLCENRMEVAYGVV